MTAQLPGSTLETSPAQHETRGRIVAGIALIAIGAVALLAQLTNWSILGWIILPTLAVIFLAWGLLTHNFGLIIPGGILGGLGLGLFSMVGPFSDLFAGAQPGVFMLCFAAGWAFITLLSPVTSDRVHWWPLIPGAIMGLVGLFLLGGGFTWAIMQLMGYAWAVILIGIGAYLLLRRKA
jgi:hypothetical protein